MDEGAATLSPGRVYDIRDPGFNAPAGWMAIGPLTAMTEACFKNKLPDSKIG